MKHTVVAAFKPHNNGLGKLFGSLEADVLTLIWERDEASARDIFEALRDRGHRISYGATKTVLDRLVKKQVLARALHANQYTYQACWTREEFTRSAVREILDSLFASFGEPVYAQFLDHLMHESPEQLDHLQELIAEMEAKQRSSSP